MSSSPWVMGARHATFSAPPSRPDPSYSATSWPRSRATRAASSPAGPPPITTTRRGCAVVPITSSPYCFSLTTVGVAVEARRRVPPATGQVHGAAQALVDAAPAVDAALIATDARPHLRCPPVPRLADDVGIG